MFQKEIERYYCFIDDINNEIIINILKYRNISLNHDDSELLALIV